MNVACPTCATIYRIDPAKVPAAGVSARCNVCAAVFPVSRNGTHPLPDATPAQVVRPPEPAPARVSAPVAIPAPASAPSLRPSAASIPAGGRPAIPTGLRPSGMFAPPVAMPPSAPAAPPRPPAIPAMPAAPPPAQSTPAPTAAPRAAVVPPGRSANPFMSQDPSQKARRLARALISDLVVYGTARRDEALKNGTLKESFGEEIKKSWEEFVDQVGKEMAESTTYFNDALNEILAGGQKIF